VAPEMVEEKKSVLVVDDEQSTLSSNKRILEKAGYLVDTAESGQEALEKAQTKRYDAALIDIKLPDMDGTDLLLKLPKNQEMVKIVITGFSDPEEGIKAADRGADEFLVKPVKPDELLSALKERLIKL
jgi:DNA-binding response OmpR family regulator